MKDAMKSHFQTAIASAALLCAATLAYGQSNPPPHFGSNNYPAPPPTNWVGQVSPPNWTNHPPHLVPPGGANPNAAAPVFPADVQASIQQFQKQRDAIVSQLKSANEARRKELLQQMEQLRLQLKEQLTAIYKDAQEQAREMQQQLSNDRTRLLNQGAGSGSGGTPGPPR